MLKEFFSYYLPHKRLFMLDFGSAVLSGILSLGFPVAVAGFVDVLLPKQDWLLIGLAAVGLLLVYLANTGLMAVVT